MTIRHYSITAAMVLAMALSASAQSRITYVEVTDGASGNTRQVATNGTAPWNGTLSAWTALTSGGIANDSLWLRRAFGNSATIYENSGAGSQDTNATRLVTSIAVGAPGSGQYYNVYGLFWTDTSPTWELGASLTNYPGQLPLYQLSTPGVTIFNNDAFVGTSTIYSTNLNPNPFTTPVMISEGNRRLLMTPVLGRATGTNITVYTEPDRGQQGQNQRTWLDGIGYQLITNQILMPLTLSNDNLTITFSGTAGRLYLIEWTASLNSPVTWTPLQSSTAGSNGLVTFTTTPAGTPDFYRIHDVTPPPSPVTTLTTSAGDTKVSLSWMPAVGATSYNVKSATMSGGPYTTVANLNATNFVVTGLVNFTTYYFVVSALNFNGEGDNSAEVNATPLPPQPPLAPTGLMATPGNNLVALSWTPSATATSYNLKSATTSGGPYTTVTNVTTTSFVNTGLANGTTNYYVVSALNPYGESPNSSETNATPAPLPPFTPTGLTAVPGNTQVSLSWAAAPGATSYNVKSATTSGGPYTTFTNVTTTSVVNTDLVNTTAYYYVVSALNDYGESPDSAQASATPFDTPPLVYAAEFTGTNFPPLTLPTVPPVNIFPLIQPLPDPFTWANDPLDTNGTRSINYYDWSHHRAEIKAEIEAYEIGPKPAVDIPTQVTASYSGGTTPGTSGTLTVHVTANGSNLTLTSAVSIPAAATAPYLVCIGMNSSYGSLNSSDLTSRGIVGVTFSHNQVTTYGSPANTDPYYRLYGPGTPQSYNINNTGQYSAWAWGVSRLIDGLTLVTNTLPVDLQHIMVTGCSYAGKMALISGAFDERVALTVAQESGGGGDTSWRYSHTEPSGSVELIDNTDYNWFANQMNQFSGNNVSYLPEDHHELMAMCAPRALYCTANTDYTWLSNPSAYVCGQACARVYQQFGVADRFGFNVDGGHSHCAFPSDQESEIQYFLDRFMKGQTNLTQTVRSAPGSYTNINYSRWTAWWGTTNAVFGP
jgi:fibronectin type 3 domain-containing protein